MLFRLQIERKHLDRIAEKLRRPLGIVDLRFRAGVVSEQHAIQTAVAVAGDLYRGGNFLRRLIARGDQQKHRENGAEQAVWGGAGHLRNLQTATISGMTIHKTMTPPSTPAFASFSGKTVVRPYMVRTSSTPKMLAMRKTSAGLSSSR